jgi:hypothetical protein
MAEEDHQRNKVDIAYHSHYVSVRVRQGGGKSGGGS